MKRKIFVITFWLASFFSISNAQPVCWDSATNWKMYKLLDREAINIIPDSLPSQSFTFIAKDQVLQYLESAALIDSASNFWQGAYVLSYEMPLGTINKLLINKPSGIIFVWCSKKYYQVDPAKVLRWRQWLKEMYDTFTSDYHN